VPHSVDITTQISQAAGSGVTYFPDGRVDAVWGNYGTDYETINSNIVAQMVAADPPVPCMVFVSHNNEGHAPGSRWHQNLCATIETAKQALVAKGLTPKAGTIGDIAKAQRKFPKATERTRLGTGGWMGSGKR
jgi:hypothetical protein